MTMASAVAGANESSLSQCSNFFESRKKFKNLSFSLLLRLFSSTVTMIREVVLFGCNNCNKSRLLFTSAEMFKKPL